MKTHGKEVSQWQADVLCAFPVVERVFRSGSRSVVLPVTASTVQEEAAPVNEDDVADFMRKSFGGEESSAVDVVSAAFVANNTADDAAVDRVVNQSDLNAALEAAVRQALK